MPAVLATDINRSFYGLGFVTDMKKCNALKLNNSVRFNENTLLGSLFILFFCESIFSSVVFRLFGRDAISPLYILLFSILYFLIVSIHIRETFIPLLVLSFVGLLFLLTYLIHPEYASWFNHETYGIGRAVFAPGCGLWAFALIWLVKDEDRIYKFLKISCWFAFLFSTLQFIAATLRGYWVYLDVDKTVIEAAYSMEFGYEMLMPVSFMGAVAFLEKERKYYYIPFICGVIMIFMGGSRGAAIWPIVMFPLMLPFKWKNMTQTQRNLFLFVFIPLCVLLLVLIYYRNALLLLLSGFLTRHGVSSRTLTSLIDGSISDANGRDVIYKSALDLIRTGGLFGWGVYGDRYVIGRQFRWGYSHNLFLELFVSFGYLGGAVFSILFLVGIFKLYRICANNRQQTVFIAFLVSSMKLMLSNSLWYSEHFWALIALMLLWKTKKPEDVHDLLPREQKT